jgi:hypothetical protein
MRRVAERKRCRASGTCIDHRVDRRRQRLFMSIRTISKCQSIYGCQKGKVDLPGSSIAIATLCAALVTAT